MSNFFDFIKKKFNGSKKTFKNYEDPDKSEKTIQPDTDKAADKQLKTSDENSCNTNEEAEFLIKGHL